MNNGQVMHPENVYAERTFRVMYFGEDWEAIDVLCCSGKTAAEASVLFHEWHDAWTNPVFAAPQLFNALRCAPFISVEVEI